MKSLAFLIVPSFVLQAWMPLVVASEHSNKCVQNLGAILDCQEISFSLGVVRNLRQCCAGIRQLATDRCECNPLISNLLGDEGSQLFRLEPVCRVVQPLAWLTVPFRPFRKRGQRCSAVRSAKTYGCDKGDVQIDSDRYSTFIAFQKLFENTADESICFDTNQFIKGLKDVMREDVWFYVPFGAGNYTGPEDVAEYLAIPFASATHGYYLRNNDPPSPGAKARFDIDGDIWYLGSTAKGGSFMRGADPYQDHYQEQTVGFRKCETKIASFDIIPLQGLLENSIEQFVQTAQLSKRYGTEDTCRYHTRYCTGDLQQYASEQECLDYMRSLPIFTEACTSQRPFAGHSLLCKWKHHLMIPTNPPLHCPHIGKLGVADSNGNFKCDDTTECTKDEGQALWPLVNVLPQDIPSERKQLYEENNIGWEDEPFPCVVAYNESLFV